MSIDEKDKELMEFAEKLARDSVPIDPEIAKLLEERFHELL